MAEINELFDQTATQALELSERIDKASQALDDMLEEAGKVARRVDEETDEVRSALKALIERLDRAESELENGRAAAETGLDAVETKAAELRERLEGLVDTARQSLSELETAKDRVEGDVDTRFQQVATNLTGLETQLEQFAGVLDEDRQQTSAALEAIAGAATEGADRTDDWVEALGALLTRQTDAMIEMANGVIERHNTVMDQVKERFADEAPKEMAAAAGEWLAEAGRLEQSAREWQESLAGKVEELVDRVGGLLTETAPVTTVLRKAEELD
jgi:ABC-type transporter Mla subunit MlaD